MDEQEKVTTTETELEIENMRDFLLENQGIKLENLPRYEDAIAPKQEVKFDHLQEVNNLPIFETRTKPKEKEEVQTSSPAQKRFKIVANCFAVIGVLLLSMVAINGVALAVLNKDIKDNQKEITTLTQEITELQNQEIDNLGGTAENIRYKLALPRNYPDNTADLTWFDKLSIFLTKIFG